MVRLVLRISRTHSISKIGWNFSGKPLGTILVVSKQISENQSFYFLWLHYVVTRMCPAKIFSLHKGCALPLTVDMNVIWPIPSTRKHSFINIMCHLKLARCWCTQRLICALNYATLEHRLKKEKNLPNESDSHLGHTGCSWRRPSSSRRRGGRWERRSSAARCRSTSAPPTTTSTTRRSAIRVQCYKVVPA